jgi:hypothetical protein
MKVTMTLRKTAAENSDENEGSDDGEDDNEGDVADSEDVGEEEEGGSSGETDEDPEEDSDAENSDNENPKKNTRKIKQSNTIPEDKKYYIDAMREFLTKLMKNHTYFLHGRRTSETESFHNVCNTYYRKGSSSTSFPLYKMKKTFAALHWNGMKTEEGDKWKEVLLKKLLELKKRELDANQAQRANN